jgi:lipoprotein signal peptidase
MRSGPVLAATVFAWMLSLDLATKAWAVAHPVATDVVYNTKDGRIDARVVMSLVAVAVTAGMSRLARWRGYPEIWGMWIGAGLLVAGVLGNGLSRLLWTPGVPDFITIGPDAWNLADFAIGVGLTGGIVSLFGTALVAYARGRIHVARP